MMMKVIDDIIKNGSPLRDSGKTHIGQNKIIITAAQPRVRPIPAIIQEKNIIKI